MSQQTNQLPLNTLRVFESAVRHKSFQLAAEELCVTAGAVAHHVRSLESWLGFPLFSRHARGITVTPMAVRYAASVRTTLEALGVATRQLIHDNKSTNVVTISAIPSYITRWLMPRLPDFKQRNKEVEVRVLAQVPAADLYRESVDVCVRLGTGPYPGLLVTDLQEENFRAYASPKYLAENPINDLQDLRSATLLHDAFEVLIPDQIDWSRWLNKVGARNLNGINGHVYSHTYLTIEAAVAGQGIAIASEAMVGKAEAQGLLTSLLSGYTVKGPYQYRLLRTPESQAKEAVRAFCEWIVDQQHK